MKNQNISDHEAPASRESVERALQALTNNGMAARHVKTGKEARDLVLALIPHNAEVMTMTSITLEQLGLTEDLNNSDRHRSVKKKLSQLNRDTDHLEMQKHGAAPEWSIGSVHAITENGSAIIASNSGSQLPGYAYGSPHVIWIVSTKKIVKNLDEALLRIREHIIPQETMRARKAYGLPDTFHTNISKLLIINREVTPDRIHVILVDEPLGF